MDSDSWTDRLASASRRYQLDFLSRSDNFLGFEEIEGEDDFREEYACPFCSDYFDIVSLCCHIDEDHPMNTINGDSCYNRFLRLNPGEIDHFLSPCRYAPFVR
ncbi:hypothetical protein F2Q68_00036664 [Brassica cretica]|uniref:Di19 zinc-binding domain-containing protein n=1 Tax=Brassica cretica TaxID=69181 RepID=A0A8S9H0J0_BRACR|nr:hypothetical protein F2Q68_00036664 [Brassica cretica]